MRFTIRVNAELRWLLFLFGVRDGARYVQVEADAILVHFEFFRCRLPRTSLVAARRAPKRWYYGIGWHLDFSGGMMVNGSRADLVELELDPPVPLWLIGIPTRCRWFFVSLEQPDEFIAALGTPARV
jgi:hypothetical protein